MKKLMALLLSLYAAFADDGEKIRDSVGIHAKRPPLGTKNSLPRCAEGSKDARG